MGAHVRHLLGGADASCRLRDLFEVAVRRGANDLLHGDEMVSHVLLLMAGHHGQEWQRRSRVEPLEFRLCPLGGGGFGCGRLRRGFGGFFATHRERNGANAGDGLGA
jgi:hypothetical protein